MEDDFVLLKRYAHEGDAEALAELVRRHSGLVYATALRVTRNEHDAEDVAQTCFLELARNARGEGLPPGVVPLRGHQPRDGRAALEDCAGPA